MAVTKEDQKTQLVLKVVTGTATNGKAITKSHSFSAVNPAVSDTDMYNVGVALGQLQTHNVQTIQRIDKANLYEEA